MAHNEQILQQDDFSQYAILNITKSSNSAVNMDFDIKTSYFDNGIKKVDYNFNLTKVKCVSSSQFKSSETINVRNSTDKTQEKVQMDIDGVLVQKKLTLVFSKLTGSGTETWILIKK